LNENCEVQVQAQQGENYYDYTHNRTRMDVGGGQSIVNLFDIQKELLVVNQTCQEYCPMQGDILTPFGPDPNATLEGTVPYDGHTCQDWQWNQTIFKIYVMEISDMFIDATGANPIPIGEVDQLTPFGQYLGTMNSTWSNFQAGTPDPALFNISGIDSCPQSPNCGDGMRQLHRLRMRRFNSYFAYAQPAALAEDSAEEDDE